MYNLLQGCQSYLFVCFLQFCNHCQFLLEESILCKPLFAVVCHCNDMIWYLKICVCESEYVYQTSTRAVWRPPRRETLIYVNMWILKLQFPILHLNINCHRHRHHHFSWVSSQGTWRPSPTSAPPAPSWSPLSSSQAAFSLQHNSHHRDADHDWHNDDDHDDGDDETMARSLAVQNSSIGDLVPSLLGTLVWPN